MLLDANYEPTFKDLIFDENLGTFFEMSEILEAAFRNFPISILQVINNEMLNSWYD